MPTFEELYRKLLLASLQNKSKEELARLAAENFDRRQLDCLFHSERHPVVWRLRDCPCPPEEQAACAARCEFGTLKPDGKRLVVDADKCAGCGECVRECKDGGLIESRDVVAMLEGLRGKKSVAYALVAPAFLGQFGAEITPGKLRSAFKRIGFDGMIEVAVFADILTLKETLKFDYQLTSCCCPMWIALIRKLYNQLMPHVPAAVSPMIACGRAIKHLHPDAITVFVGPCLAEKAEAREQDLRGAVDFVLTFQETREIFEAMRLKPAALEESEKEFSSRTGRIYARAGGVSEAVETTLERLNPGRRIAIKSRCADGVAACKAMLNDLLAGKADANFHEGMGCAGGCVGGPKSLVDKEAARKNVDRYGDSAVHPTPIGNPYAVDLLRRLGLKLTDDLVERSDIFTRKF